MAENAANDIKYFILINKEHKSDLAGIRLWNNLKIAFDEDAIWVKDLDYVQVNSLEVKSIPYKSIYYEQHGKLFPQNSRLPERNVPALLWTPIDRALPIQLPGFNHNYFGINQTVSMNLIPRENEMEAEGMITSIDTLEQYIETAPAIRLQKIKWAILNNDKVFLVGTPLLPITGETYWKRNQFIIPSGFDFELFSLSDSLNILLNEDNQHFIIWNTDNTYALLNKDDLKLLSIGSFRMTMKKFISQTER